MVAAETVSIVALAVSITSLVWALALFWLSGARLQVRLVPAALTLHGHLLRGPDRGWRDEIPDEMTGLDDVFVDLAIIKVTNVGRVPTSVSDIALDFGRTAWIRRGRHTISGRPVEVHHCKALAGDDVRLEPGESISVAVDHEPLVDCALTRERLGAGRDAVRATATPAGRRSRRSSWRRRWLLGPGSSIYAPGERSADHQAFLETFRMVHTFGDVTKLYEAWVEVGAFWLYTTEGASELASRLRPLVEASDADWRLVVAATQILEAFPAQRDVFGELVGRGHYAEAADPE